MRIRASARKRNGDIHGPLGVGHLTLTADNDRERELITSLYWLIGMRFNNSERHFKARKFMEQWVDSFPQFKEDDRS